MENSIYNCFLRGIIGILIRINIPETDEYKKYSSKDNIKIANNNFIKEFIIIIILTWVGVVITYTSFIYSSVMLNNIALYSNSDTFFLLSLSIFVMIISIPISSYIADITNRRNVILSALAIIVVTFPVYLIALSLKIHSLIYTFQLIISIPCGMYFSVAPVIIAEILPVNIRFRGSAFLYNISSAIFGVSIPFIGSFSFSKNENMIPLVAYIVIVCFLAIYSIIKYNDKFNVIKQK